MHGELMLIEKLEAEKAQKFLDLLDIIATNQGVE